VGWFVGNGPPSGIVACIWDTETSGLLGSAGGVGLNTAEMMDPYMLAQNGFVNDPNWVLDAGHDYPRLAWEDTHGQNIPEPSIDWLTGEGTPEAPYRIDTADQLILLSKASIMWDKHFTLGANIDLDQENLTGRCIFQQAPIQVLAGVFDGGGHVISNLRIEGGSYLGLFGYLTSTAEVKNVGLVEVIINGSGKNIGGLVGFNSGGEITNCCSRGSIRGNSYVGGLVGRNGYGNVTYSYSTCEVEGNRHVGGLVGSNSRWNWDNVIACFWDIMSSGQTTSEGGTGKTTAEMQTASTFLEAGWDFVDETINGTDDIWWILESQDYPRLWSERIPEN